MQAPDAKAEPGDQGQFTLDRPVRAFRHLHFRAKFRRLAAAKRDSCGTRAGVDRLLAFSVNRRFLEGLASNWQAAVLQLGSLIVFSSFLYQRGAPHSRDPRKAPREQERWNADRFGWFYRNSLSLAFLLLFLLSLALHVVFGTYAYNEERSLAGQPPISIAAFPLSAKFWSVTLQTWQAEYLVIALYVVLTIFLRQQDSPESKPVESSNATTGEANK